MKRGHVAAKKLPNEFDEPWVAQILCDRSLFRLSHRMALPRITRSNGFPNSPMKCWLHHRLSKSDSQELQSLTSGADFVQVAAFRC